MFFLIIAIITGEAFPSPPPQKSRIFSMPFTQLFLYCSKKGSSKSSGIHDSFCKMGHHTHTVLLLHHTETMRHIKNRTAVYNIDTSYLQSKLCHSTTFHAQQDENKSKLIQLTRIQTWLKLSIYIYKYKQSFQFLKKQIRSKWLEKYFQHLIF